MLFVFILLLIIAVASFVAFGNANQIYADNINRDARRVAELAAIEINTAAGVGDGYSHRFSMPQKLYGNTNYTVFINSNQLYISSNARTYMIPLLAYNITGSIKFGENTIKNSKGLIQLV